MTAASAASSSRTRPRSTACSRPGDQRRAASAGCSRGSDPGASGAPPSTSSSPVDSTPTRGPGHDRARRRTPTLASTPRWAGREHGAGGQHDLAACARRRRRGARRRRPPTGRPIRTTAVAVGLGVLHHHDGVGARRQRRAGHDAHGLARLRPASVGAAPAARTPTTSQLDRRAGGVGGPHGVAVDGGVVERRDVLGRDATSSAVHAAERVAQGDGHERRAAGRPPGRSGGRPRAGSPDATVPAAAS